MSMDIRQGDCLGLLREMPAGSVRCCVTSPPYWGLRDYGHDGQIGLERTPEEYVARLVEVFREVRRVLADDGTLWLNLGDCYAGAPVGTFNGGGFKDKSAQTGGRDMSGVETSGRLDKTKGTGLKPKNLVGIPWRVAFALQADGWYLRSEIIWAKPNPMPESVTDRPTKAHEYVFLLAKSQRYYYDAAAIAEPALDWSRGGPGVGIAPTTHYHPNNGGNGGLSALAGKYKAGNAMPTRNRRTVWTVTTQPFAGAHFAVMPEALVEPCILAGSAPGDTVVDPFAGSGTVGVVALRYGRRFIGCELNAEYAQMARRRVAGPLFAEVAP